MTIKLLEQNNLITLDYKKSGINSIVDFTVILPLLNKSKYLFMYLVITFSIVLKTHLLTFLQLVPVLNLAGIELTIQNQP